MTISVKVSRDPKDVPQSLQVTVEQQLGTGKDAFWQPAEIGSLLPGESREFTLWHGKRIVLSE